MSRVGIVGVRVSGGVGVGFVVFVGGTVVCDLGVVCHF